MKTKTNLKAGEVVTLLTSYCQDDDQRRIDGCTDNNPCEDCVRMCNQFILITDAEAKYFKQVDADFIKRSR